MSDSSGTLETYALRLRPGQELRGALMEFVNERGLESAFILTCCGSVTQATLRFANNGHTNVSTYTGTELLSK